MTYYIAGPHLWHTKAMGFTPPAQCYRHVFCMWRYVLLGHYDLVSASFPCLLYEVHSQVRITSAHASRAFKDLDAKFNYFLCD